MTFIQHNLCFLYEGSVNYITGEIQSVHHISLIEQSAWGTKIVDVLGRDRGTLKIPESIHRGQLRDPQMEKCWHCTCPAYCRRYVQYCSLISANFLLNSIEHRRLRMNWKSFSIHLGRSPTVISSEIQSHSRQGLYWHAKYFSNVVPLIIVCGTVEDLHSSPLRALRIATEL